jgi:hypothetical protein
MSMSVSGPPPPPPPPSAPPKKRHGVLYYIAVVIGVLLLIGVVVGVAFFFYVANQVNSQNSQKVSVTGITYDFGTPNCVGLAPTSQAGYNSTAGATQRVFVNFTANLSANQSCKLSAPTVEQANFFVSNDNLPIVLTPGSPTEAWFDVQMITPQTYTGILTISILAEGCGPNGTGCI